VIISVILNLAKKHMRGMGREVIRFGSRFVGGVSNATYFVLETTNDYFFALLRE
jgi:hypothetical protein